MQLIAAATVGYAVAVEGSGVLLATESLEYTLAMVAELFTGRTVARLELVFEDEAKEYVPPAGPIEADPGEEPWPEPKE